MGLMELLMGGASVAGGGLFGILGRLANRHFEMKEARQRHQQAMEIRALDDQREVRLFQHEMALREKAMQQSAMETEQEILIAAENGSWNGLSASMAHDASIQDVSQWVQNVRALTRPALTLLLWLLVGLFFFFVPESRPIIINAVLAAATGATLWWFGDRMARKSGAPSLTLSAGPSRVSPGA